MIRLANEKDSDFSLEQVEPTYESMQNWDAKQWALFKHCSEDLDLVEDINLLDDIDTDEIDFNDEKLLVLTEEEADERWEDELDNYIDECILSNVPVCYRGYFDKQAWKRDTRMYEGRGQVISCYDGDENQYYIEFDDGTQCWINIYRM